MSRVNPLLAKRHYAYLPQVCYHGYKDPHRCMACHQTARDLEKDAAVKQSREEADDPRYAIAEQTWTAPELEAFEEFLQAKFPGMEPGPRAIAYLNAPFLREEWETIRQDLPHRELF